MKTLKSSLVAITLLFVTIAATAGGKPPKNLMTEDAVVNTYIDAISTGNSKALDKILDDNMQFTMRHGNNINTTNKATFIKSMENAIAVAPIKTSTAIIQSDDYSEKVKITFTYNGYSRTDVVTLNRTVDWSITGIANSYN